MSTTTDSSTGPGWLGVGALLAAVGASLCCVLPVVVAFAGVGSAAFGAMFEPYRPHMIGATVLLLGFAFYRAYRPAEAECAPGESCAVPENRRRQRLLLWVVAIVAMLLLTFPYYIGWIL
ncbi:MAG: mercuric transporter MerT family protein [Thermoanaerobaculia bacterium]